MFRQIYDSHGKQFKQRRNWQQPGMLKLQANVVAGKDWGIFSPMR
jgi:hypothetical protein